MTIESLNKRLIRLGDSASPLSSIADTLDAACARQKARRNGRPPATPALCPPTHWSRRQARTPAGRIERRGARLPRCGRAKSSCRAGSLTSCKRPMP